MKKGSSGPLRVGRNEINEEEEGFPVGSQEEQWFRVRNELGVFIKVRSGRDRGQMLIKGPWLCFSREVRIDARFKG